MQRAEVSRAARALLGLRQELCLERKVGLTSLYNEVEEGMHRALEAAHLELDRAVVAAYGWDRSLVEDPEESNRRLHELNQKISRGEVLYSGPG